MPSLLTFMQHNCAVSIAALVWMPVSCSVWLTSFPPAFDVWILTVMYDNGLCVSVAAVGASGQVSFRAQQISGSTSWKKPPAPSSPADVFPVQVWIQSSVLCLFSRTCFERLWVQSISASKWNQSTVRLCYLQSTAHVAENKCKQNYFTLNFFFFLHLVPIKGQTIVLVCPSFDQNPRLCGTAKSPHRGI